MEVSPRSPASGIDASESVGDSWVIPSSSGHLVPRRHNSDQASAVVKPAPGTRSVPKGGGIQRYFKPKSKANDHIFNKMPDPVASASPAQQPGCIVSYCYQSLGLKNTYKKPLSFESQRFRSLSRSLRYASGICDLRSCIS